MNLFPAESKPAISLRPYQQESVDRIMAMRQRGARRLLMVMATGLGKTTTFAELCKLEKDSGGKSIVIAHREELIDQAARRIVDQTGLTVSVEGGANRSDSFSDVVVASVATIGRKDSLRPLGFKPSLVVIDEAHHAAADTYTNYLERVGAWDDGGPDVIGVTATPHRMDNRPLHGRDEAIFEEIAYNYGIVPAIQDEWLCDIVAYRLKAGFSLEGVKRVAGDYSAKHLESRLKNREDTMIAFNGWADVARDRKTVIFCTTVDHAKFVADIWREMGVKAEHVDGSMDKSLRRAIIQRFRDGETQVLTNCQIATEGFDVPDIGCVVMLRPTQSWALFTQCVGRGLRPAPGKENCIIIDVVGAGDGKSLASVPEILDLPPTYSGQGESMKEAIQAISELEEWQLALLRRKAFDLRGIPGVLQQVDLLAELSPSSLVQSASKFTWQEISDGFILRCGVERKNTPRVAKLTCDTLGKWFFWAIVGREVVYSSNLGDCSIETALQNGDLMVQEIWPRAVAIVHKDAAWRKRKPTEKQQKLLMRFGYSREEIDRMDSGMAKSAIDIIARNGWKRPADEVVR